MAASPELHSAVAELPSLGQTVLSLIVVLGVIFALAALLKRLQGVKRGGTADLRIHAGLQVGPKERVLLIEAGGAHLLVGVAPGQIRTLHVYDEPPTLQSGTSKAPVSSAFTEALKRALGQDTQS